jgi:subtilisin family serine protease
VDSKSKEAGVTTTKHAGGPARLLAGAAVLLAGAALLLGVLPTAKAQAETAALKTYIVVFKATQAQEGQFQLGGDLAANQAAALDLLTSAGGTITADLTKEIGVAIVDSASETFAETVSGSDLVEIVGEDFSWKGLPSQAEFLSGGGVVTPTGGGGPEPSTDPLETQQWDMRMIRTEQAHAVQSGWNEVEVAIVDSGIDATHVDFMDPTGQITNVDCLKSKDFVVLVGPGVGTPVPCQDNLFHGTHVAGTVAAQANRVGIVGVAPNVSLISIKVCDSAEGYCYASSSIAGIAYAGSIQAEVMNMSFFVDDDAFRVSTELKCDSDPKQRAFKEGVNRSIAYARSQGVTPVAAAGNSRTDLGKSKTCDVVPTESPGVMSVVSLGPSGRIASYSSYGKGTLMVSAPGGDGGIGPNWCNVQVFSTIPGEAYGCFQGTSMASPHAAGVAALIVSQIGTMGADGDVVSNPDTVLDRLARTAKDIGKYGYDRCYGWGRVDAYRAVINQQSRDRRDDTIPDCGR